MGSNGKFTKSERDQMRTAGDNAFADDPDKRLLAKLGTHHLESKARPKKTLGAVVNNGADVIELAVIPQGPPPVRHQAGYVVVSFGLDRCARLDGAENHAFDPSTVHSYLGRYDEAGFRTKADALEDAELFHSRKHARSAATLAGPEWEPVRARDLTTETAWIRLSDSGLTTPNLV